MTITGMHNYFNLVQDKDNEPLFLEDEIDVFLNRAQDKLVNNIIFKDILGQKDIPKGPQALYGLEDSITSNMVLTKLYIIDDIILSDAVGYEVLYSSANYPVMHILSVGTTSPNSGGNLPAGVPLRYVRHNDWLRFSQNTFKAGSLTKPYYRIAWDGIYITPPSGAIENIKISYLTNPTEVSKSGAVSCSLPSVTHEKIVAMALEIAGVATESEALMMADKL